MSNKLGIIGQGFVGSAVYEGMKNFFDVYTFDINGKWAWAKTGISDVYLDSGDSIGLMFSVNGKTKFPK